MLKSTYKPVVAAPLPAGWTEYKAPTALGHPYYYNAVTKESTYIRPVETHSLPNKSPQSIGVLGEAPGHPRDGVYNGHPPGGFSNSGSFSRHPFAPDGSYRGRGGFNGHSHQQRPQPVDRPKSKHLIPGCEPWLLVHTKLGRRFVYNPDKRESFWKFPVDIMKGVVEFDRLQRENKERKEKLETSDSNDDALLAEAEAEALAAAEGPIPTAAPAPAPREINLNVAGEDSDEYEEVEVTDDEDDENPSKRPKIEEDGADQPVEFNEDDIAYQLAAMGQDYGLDPGEYGEGGEGLEEGAEGLALTEEDSSALFKDMLDDYHINPYTPWDKVIEVGHIIADDRYVVLPNMKSRKEVWGEWSRERIQRFKEQREREEKKDPRIPYLSFLQTHATPKLYWPEFRRKYKKELEMRDAKLSDKDREKYYRDYINRLKLAEPTLKADLVTLLKAIPLHLLNRSTTLDALPPTLLVDLRYISLRPSIRDPMIEAYFASLPPAPDNIEIPLEEEEARRKERQERERREKALSERQRQVQEMKRKQKGQLLASKGMLREGEEEIERAMRVGKEGLRGYMEGEVKAGADH